MTEKKGIPVKVERIETLSRGRVKVKLSVDSFADPKGMSLEYKDIKYTVVKRLGRKRFIMREESLNAK